MSKMKGMLRKVQRHVPTCWFADVEGAKPRITWIGVINGALKHSLVDTRSTKTMSRL